MCAHQIWGVRYLRHAILLPNAKLTNGDKLVVLMAASVTRHSLEQPRRRLQLLVAIMQVKDDFEL